jgi:hypothetical protein
MFVWMWGLLKRRLRRYVLVRRRRREYLLGKLVEIVSIQKHLRGFLVRRANVESRAGLAKRALLRRVVMSKAGVSGVVCIQRWLRGWRVRRRFRKFFDPRAIAFKADHTTTDNDIEEFDVGFFDQYKVPDTTIKVPDHIMSLIFGGP